MKRTTAHVTTIFAALFLLATATSVQAAACSNATLKGNYAALLTGVSGGLPVAALDHVTADGLGNLTGTGTINVNGTVSSGVPLSATYSINADCTGSATFSSGTTQNLIIKLNGAQVYIIRTGPATTATVETGIAYRLSGIED